MHRKTQTKLQESEEIMKRNFIYEIREENEKNFNFQFESSLQKKHYHTCYDRRLAMGLKQYRFRPVELKRF